MKINWKSVGAAAITTVGLISQAGATGAYGAKAAPWLTLLGIVLQSVTHPVAGSSN